MARGGWWGRNCITYEVFSRGGCWGWVVFGMEGRSDVFEDLFGWVRVKSFMHVALSVEVAKSFRICSIVESWHRGESFLSLLG